MRKRRLKRTCRIAVDYMDQLFPVCFPHHLPCLSRSCLAPVAFLSRSCLAPASLRAGVAENSMGDGRGEGEHAKPCWVRPASLAMLGQASLVRRKAVSNGSSLVSARKPDRRDKRMTGMDSSSGQPLTFALPTGSDLGAAADAK